MALTVTACGKGEGDEDVRGVTCDDVLDTDLVMQIDALGDRPVTEALVVTGGVVHKRGFAVHRVTVLDEAAENVEFNFTRWSATLSAETLKARRNGDGMLTVDATAVDTCGNEQSADVTIKLVEPVASLAFAEPGIPGGESFLPADGTTPATLELTANAEAAGATVSLQVSGGGLFPGLSSNDVVLSGDGSASTTSP
ncbi:MAG: hypothetical protein KC731_25660, partial [Myxococcales bacterium]|nr:hypothetical protein [Myxococcales bacterium]